MKSRSLKAAAICAAVLLLAAVSARVWLPWPAQALLVPDSLAKSDCIVMLQGDLYPRSKMAAQLFREGYAPAIIVSPLKESERGHEEYYYFEPTLWGVPHANSLALVEKALAYFGKDMQGVSFSRRECTSTFEEALAARELMREKGYTSMVLVTSTYHMRRALMIFRHVFRGSGVRISYATGPHPIYDPSRWWQKEADAEMIGREYLACFHNILYHFILRKVHTSFDM